MESGESTLNCILRSAQEEFLLYGFRGASLRRIVKNAGVTTGAFYGYFSSKEAVFDALAGPHAHIFLEKFNQAQFLFNQLPPEQQLENMSKISSECMEWMLDYMYAHLPQFKLLLCCAEGTKYENFLHELVVTEEDSTHRFIEVLESLGYHPKHIDKQLEHILISGMFTGFFETVIHDMPKSQSRQYIKELREFYTAGWMKIMGLSL